MYPVIRPVRTEDAASILAIYAPYILETPVTFEETVPDIKEMVSRIENLRNDLPFLVCEIDGQIAGYAYASNHRNRSAYRWTKELSVYVHPLFRRKNIGKALYSCIIELLKYQGVKSVLAGITVPNPESTGFHENFGFIKAAEFHATGYKLGQWHNVGWWEMDLNPGMKSPCLQLIPFSAISENTLGEIVRNGIKHISL